MLSILFRILLLAFILWLFRHFLDAIMRATKKGRAKNNSAEPANHMVKDPVCGMYMDSRLAVRLEDRKEAFYFCSEECKKKYLSGLTEEGTGPAAAR
jgi:uncharacterized protein